MYDLDDTFELELPGSRLETFLCAAFVVAWMVAGVACVMWFA